MTRHAFLLLLPATILIGANTDDVKWINERKACDAEAGWK